MLLIQKASSDRSLLNTLKLNLTSRRFDRDNFKKFAQLHKKHYQHEKEWLDLRSFSGEKENYSSNKKIFAFSPKNYIVF